MKSLVARTACRNSSIATTSLMHHGLESPRMYGSWCSLFPETIRPLQTAVTSVQVQQPSQSASWLPWMSQPITHAHQTDSLARPSGSSAPAFMPLLPAQVQAALRTAEVHQLLSPETTAGEASAQSEQEGMLCATKRTYQPSVIIRKRRHGFLSRISSRGGRNVMRRRKAKGRYNITA